MPGAAIHTPEIERPLASAEQTLEYALCDGQNVPLAEVQHRYEADMLHTIIFEMPISKNVFMQNYIIKIYRNKDGQDELCCSGVASGGDETAAELLAIKCHKEEYPHLSENIHAKSCGETEQKPDDNEKFTLLNMYIYHSFDVET